jgi:3-phosphoshikimate 1-carboxyvinyltransferase
MSVGQHTMLRPASALRGTLRVPSDKSIAHRALLGGALATGESHVRLREPGDDVRSTLGALRALGVDAHATDTDARLDVVIAGLGDGHAIGRLGSGTADCGNSGTSMRLLCGALAAGGGVATLVGDASLSGRPMDRIAAPLRVMDAEVHTTNGHAPLVITGRRPLRSVEHRLSVPSAQLLGAISIAALAAEGTTRVLVPGPTRDHTERMLAAMGASISRTTAHAGTLTTIDGPSPIDSIDIEVPGDFSSAAAWIVAGALHRDADIRIEGVGLNPTRVALIEVLRRMGADIAVERESTNGGEPVGDVVVRSSGTLSSTTIDPDEVPALIDELPLICVAMAAADGTSEVRGAHELRVKESDRIATMTAALSAAGAKVEELPDGWRIARGKASVAVVETRADHRIAMSMAVAAWAGVASAVTLDDAACVAVSYPSFWNHAREIGALG